MTDVILKEFSTHPKIYIWDGEGTFTAHMRSVRHVEIFVILDMLSRFSSLQILTHTWGILHGLMLSS